MREVNDGRAVPSGVGTLAGTPGEIGDILSGGLWRDRTHPAPTRRPGTAKKPATGKKPATSKGGPR